IEYGGYRLKGVRNAVKAARYAYQNNWNVPVPPRMPEMKVSTAAYTEPGATTATIKPLVVWDKRAEVAADFAGYKIYRAGSPEYNSAQFGTRFLDRYHHQGAADIGLTDAELEAKFGEPKNPNNSVPAGYDLVWNPGSHGPWKLMVYIPKAELGKYINTGSDASTYSYKWLDTSQAAQSGGIYWYYVAAFDNEIGTIAGQSFASLESGKENFNGRWGEWLGTYPFATSALDFPTDAAGRKMIGAPFVLVSENPADAKIEWTTNNLNFGRIRVGDQKDFSNELIISNQGITDLVIDSVLVPEGFKLGLLPKFFPVKVTPTAGTNPKLVLAVSFQPLKAGDFAGNLLIYHSDADTPVLSIALSGQASQISNTVVAGNRWYQFGLAGRACSIQGNVLNQNTLYVYNMGESGYFVSYDGGGNWEFQSVVRPDSAEIFFHDYLVNTASNFNEKLFFDPTMHGRLYYEYIYQTKKSGTSISKNKTFRSDDNGVSWIEIFTGHVRVTSILYNSRLIIDPKNSNKVYRGFQNSIAFSGDRGNSWVDLRPGMNGDILIIDPSNSNHLLYYSIYGITQSATGGLSWEPLQNLPGACSQLAIDPINGNVLYGLFKTGENKLHKSYDSGLTWSEINSGINFNNVLQTNLIYPTLVINPQNNSEVFFGTRSGSPPIPQSIIYGTNNGGFSWKKLRNDWNKYSSHIDSLAVNSLLFENQTGNRILYAATNDGIYKIVNPVTLVSEPQSEAIPNTFKLFQNYPNPFNPETVIRYQLPNPAKVTLKIYNLMGQEIRTLITEQKAAGYFTAYWDGKDDLSREVPSGVYIYRLQAKHFVSIKKMILLH
ncbi:T9SS type A sorting domain-containing protein, partial [candidate division KSB1 bacterium]|nr:T9SS type A sorting domain-containing protein [candidate division KSB1 bacterium]